MKDPTLTPEPIIKRKEVKELRPECNIMKEMKAQMYGYSAGYSKIIGESQVLKQKRLEPVAYDTNQTRRKMIKPTDKGSY